MFLNIFLLSKAFAEIPPFPPLKKGGGGGIYEDHFKKLNAYEILNLEIVSNFVLRISNFREFF